MWIIGLAKKLTSSQDLLVNLGRDVLLDSSSELVPLVGDFQ